MKNSKSLYYMQHYNDSSRWKHFLRYWPLTAEQTIETPVIWDAIMLIIMSL